MGASIAYYLSDPDFSDSKRDIHIIDTSPKLFASASGYAAGFLARNWFSPEVEELGDLSFRLHRQLAAEHNGREKWGYMNSTALSLQVNYGDGTLSRSGHDWLQRGASRAEAATREEEMDDPMDSHPSWLTQQKGGVVDRISDDGCTAQVYV